MRAAFEKNTDICRFVSLNFSILETSNYRKWCVIARLINCDVNNYICTKGVHHGWIHKLQDLYQNLHLWKRVLACLHMWELKLGQGSNGGCVSVEMDLSKQCLLAATHVENNWGIKAFIKDLARFKNESGTIIFQ